MQRQFFPKNVFTNLVFACYTEKNTYRRKTCNRFLLFWAIRNSLFLKAGSYTIAESVTPPHIHAMPELFIALKGEAVISGDFGKRQITGRNACLIPPRLYHDVACDTSYNRIALLFVFRKTSSGTDILDTYSAFCERFCAVNRLSPSMIRPS